MNLEDTLKEFLYHVQAKNFSVRTIKGYRNNNAKFFVYLLSEFSIDELEDIKPLHVKSYLMFLKNKGRKETYINTILKAIRAFFNFCEEEDYVLPKNNPCNKVKWMKEPKTLIKTFTDDEIKAMINVYNTTTYLEARNKLIIMMFTDLGIRCLELCDLLESNVTETSIIIRGKGNKERYLYISPVLKKYMIKYERIKKMYFKDSLKSYPHYFLSNNGYPLTVTGVEKFIKIAGQKAGVRQEIRCSPHSFRHYFAQKQLQNGLDVYSLSRLLGHEGIEITKIYLQSLDDTKIVDSAINTSPLMTI
ncbi:tyrosine-type recombinase/integrase [Fictibacillus enclensis]|uniref:tyrosine-type recombinase/integrase n=1 Tax=Fictibacillus enclensis TaxID=1017270 RepID=UPI0025A061F7|nr:tyrosine-type recombinase/integrase [Fictibacillus enclensis]MDM5199221.1 tyrosine-type recombinase/integrase [Fictibacillus enclensis]